MIETMAKTTNPFQGAVELMGQNHGAHESMSSSDQSSSSPPITPAGNFPSMSMSTSMDYDESSNGCSTDGGHHQHDEESMEHGAGGSPRPSSLPNLAENGHVFPGFNADGGFVVGQHHPPQSSSVPPVVSAAKFMERYMQGTT
jgi:hypothetical protein